MNQKKCERNEEIDALLEIINNQKEYMENSTNGLVILLNGSWGSGKTTFLKDLENKVRQDKNYELFSTYVSYSYDFYDNAYLPFFACIEDKLKLGHNFGKFIKSTKSIGNGMLSVSYSITRSLFKNKIGIDLNDIRDNMLDIQNEEYLKNFNDFKECKSSIKHKLENYHKQKKKIFIIDELDRCKPNFAIDTLEIIKHFFDIENFVFVVALDKMQLQESAKAIYGQGLDSEKYFSKFFDYQFNLLPLNFNDIVDTTNIQNIDEIINRSTSIFNYLQVSSRDSKKIFTDFFNKYKKYSPENSWTEDQCLFVIFLLTLKYVDLLFYNELVNGNYGRFKKKVLDSYSTISNNYSKLFKVGIGDNKDFDHVCECLSSALYVRYIDLDKIYETPFMHDKKLEYEKSVAREMMIYVPQIKKDITYRETIQKIVN